MQNQFQCFNDYKNELDEINTIIKLASKNIKNNDLYNLYNKSAILLFCAKFEKFLENLLSEYVYRLEELQIPPFYLDDIMKLNSTRFALNEKFFNHLNNTNLRAIDTLKTILNLWVESDPSKKIIVNYKFNYGKHGSKEVKRFFRRIGIDNIFQECKVYKMEEDISTGRKYRSYISIEAEINSLINHRNHITHEAKNPNITHTQILKYKIVIFIFSKKIISYLENRINDLSKHSPRSISVS